MAENKEQLYNMLDDVIKSSDDEGQLHFHNYLVGKFQEMIGNEPETKQETDSEEE